MNIRLYEVFTKFCIRFIFYTLTLFKCNRNNQINYFSLFIIFFAIRNIIFILSSPLIKLVSKLFDRVPLPSFSRVLLDSSIKWVWNCVKSKPSKIQFHSGSLGRQSLFLLLIFKIISKEEKTKRRRRGGRRRKWKLGPRGRRDAGEIQVRSFSTQKWIISRKLCKEYE